MSFAAVFSLPGAVAEELSEFLEHVLVPDPAKRPSAAELLQHPFLANDVEDEGEETTVAECESSPEEATHSGVPRDHRVLSSSCRGDKV
jgi:serine/threonine protein kinase